MKLSRISSGDGRMKKSTKKYKVINFNFELQLYVYIFLQFSMEISKQNYLIGQQRFATAYYPSYFSHLHMGASGRPRFPVGGHQPRRGGANSRGGYVS